MNRREVIKLLCGSATAFPLTAGAQQPGVPVIGVLSGIDLDAREFGAIQQGLNETGYVAGRNLVIELGSAAGQYDRLPELAADLVRRKVSVIISVEGTAASLAAKAATTAIPVVFSIGSDPVKAGLVESFNRPGGNVTGVSFLANALAAKRLGLLHELTPGATSLGNLVNLTNPNSEAETRELQTAAQTLGQRLQIVSASSESEIDAAFASFAERRVDAIIVSADAFYTSRRYQIVAQAARQKLPAIYFLREFPAAGGLMSYGASITDAFRQVGVYAGRILKGAKPADLPVLQSTKFELVINNQTARMSGLTVPPSLLAIADEVIE